MSDVKQRWLDLVWILIFSFSCLEGEAFQKANGLLNSALEQLSMSRMEFCLQEAPRVGLIGSWLRGIWTRRSTCSAALKATSSILRADRPSCSLSGAIIWAPAAATSCSTATTQVSCLRQSISVSDTWNKTVPCH